MKPFCFMVMPFGTRPIPNAKEGAPNELDCDRLWDAAFRPALEALNYIPIRADLDPGAVIVKDMLNRLKHADLVLADVSLPNGNVYYEIGIRHVAKEKQCVLIAADWFKPLFDLAQIRTLTYPLSDGRVSEEEAETIKALLIKELPRLLESRTPYHELVTERVEEAFQEEAQSISLFQGGLARARLMPKGDARSALVDELIEEYGPKAMVVREVAHELLSLIRDTQGWESVRQFTEKLPPAVQSSESIQEQYFLALSKIGEHEKAIAGLQELVKRFGPTPERCGLIGGRFKVLFRAARKARQQSGADTPTPLELGHLQSAIKYYEQGMNLDLNEYYCACNLPALLRERGKSSDLQRAETIDRLVVAACQRAERNGSQDPWLPDTLFGTAFRGGDLAALEDIIEEVERGIPWRLGATLNDAEDWIEQAPENLRDELERSLARLASAHQQAAGS